MTVRQLITLSGLTLALYGAMVFGPLASLQDMAGAAPMDMRPTGYTPDAVRGFLERIGEAGRRLYLTRQIPLDMLYPALLALTLVGWLAWMGRGGGWIAVVASLFDYAENLLIVAMIWGFPDVPDGLARLASGVTVLKSGFSTVAFVWILWSAGVSACRNTAQQHARPQQRTASGRRRRRPGGR